MNFSFSIFCLTQFFSSFSFHFFNSFFENFFFVFHSSFISWLQLESCLLCRHWCPLLCMNMFIYTHPASMLRAFSRYLSMAMVAGSMIIIVVSIDSKLSVVGFSVGCIAAVVALPFHVTRRPVSTCSLHVVLEKDCLQAVWHRLSETTLTCLMQPQLHIVLIVSLFRFLIILFNSLPISSIGSTR